MPGFTNAEYTGVRIHFVYGFYYTNARVAVRRYQCQYRDHRKQNRCVLHPYNTAFIAACRIKRKCLVLYMLIHQLALISSYVKQTVRLQLCPFYVQRVQGLQPWGSNLCVQLSWWYVHKTGNEPDFCVMYCETMGDIHKEWSKCFPQLTWTGTGDSQYCMALFISRQV